MSNLSVPHGDKGFIITFTVYTDNTFTVVKDLTGYIVKVKAWPPGSPTNPVINTACALTATPTDGKANWTVLAADTAAAIGTYDAELEMTQSGVIESTQNFRISITESA